MNTAKVRRIMLPGALLVVALCRPGFGQDAAAAAVDSGDTAWVLMSAGLVLLMTPGLAFFYGGLVRKKNVLSVLMQCFTIMCLVTMQWVVLGYSLAFGPDIAGVIGDLSWAGLRGVGAAPNADYAATIPHLAFMAFQLMLWTTFVYDPVAHWVWGVGGFLRQSGALDFAGGTVVHVNAGLGALAAALVLGKRQGYPSNISPPHNLPFAVLGAGMLWFGWFGFNAGSALAANGLAANAFMVTHAAAAAAGFTWAAIEWVLNSRPTMLGMISGALAGLVAITPAAGFVTVAGAILIGAGASIVCYSAVAFVKARMGYDDTLDAFGIHGVGGVWGAITTGIFATKAVNPAAADGLLYGNPVQLWIQIKATVVTIVYAFVVSLLLLKVANAICGLRVGQEEERIGLDLTLHREAGYTMLE
jgi:Amt family ammonium transporter